MLVGSEAGLYKVKRTADIDLGCPELAAKWEELRKGRVGYSCRPDCIVLHCVKIINTRIKYYINFYPSHQYDILCRLVTQETFAGWLVLTRTSNAYLIYKVAIPTSLMVCMHYSKNLRIVSYTEFFLFKLRELFDGSFIPSLATE